MINTHTHTHTHTHTSNHLIDKEYFELLKEASDIVGVKFFEVQMKKLDEIGEFYGGLTGKSKNDFINGNAKFITYKNVYKNLSVNLEIENFVKIDEDENQRYLELGDIIFTGSSETPDECGISSVITEKLNEKFYLNSFCFFLRLDNKSILLPNFSKYLFRSEKLRKEISKTASGVTRFNVSKELMKKIKIPIPSLQVQEYIVSILDKFDILVNDISKGLPKEIELRQKQYEHHREKLLGFKRSN